VIDASSVAPAPPTLTQRYSCDDLGVFDQSEQDRFLTPFRDLAEAALGGDERAWSEIGPHLAWEIFYRKEPELYERLIAGERIHPEVLERLPRVNTAVEVGAGTGRLTTEVAERAKQVIAVEPAAPMRSILATKLSERSVTNVVVQSGFFDALGLADASAEAIISCSSFTADPTHGGQAGLEEMTRVATPGGKIVIVWPTDIDWLRFRGFRYESFDGEMSVDFGSLEEAVELAEIFYPHSVREIVARKSARVPYDVLGMNPPCDLAWRRMP
jgi:SAM-dependent methyltransferase